MDTMFLLFGNTCYDRDNDRAYLCDLMCHPKQVSLGDFYLNATNRNLKSTFVDSQICINGVTIAFEAM